MYRLEVQPDGGTAAQFESDERFGSQQLETRSGSVADGISFTTRTIPSKAWIAPVSRPPAIAFVEQQQARCSRPRVSLETRKLGCSNPQSLVLHRRLSSSLFLAPAC